VIKARLQLRKAAAVSKLQDGEKRPASQSTSNEIAKSGKGAHRLKMTTVQGEDSEA